MNNKIKIIITVQGGLVQSVSSNNANLEYVVLDYDSDDRENPVWIKHIEQPDGVFEDGKGCDMIPPEGEHRYRYTDGDVIAKQYLIDNKF